MSTFLHTRDSKRILSEADLKSYFQNFARPASDWLVGIECEVFGVHAKTGEALPYKGERSVQAVLDSLAYTFGYEKITEEGSTIALRKPERIIGLEPGGQIECSAVPVSNVHQVQQQLEQFFFELKTVKHLIGEVDFLACGVHPFSPVKSIDWIPKKRYAVMSRFLARRGRLAHDMMKRTASVQVSFDYENETDAFEKMCLIMRLSPIAYALFAHSSFSKGRASGYVSERLHIWRFTDRSRSGLILSALCPHASFEVYLQYLLDLPMIFIVRDGTWVKLPALSFRKFIQKGYQGIYPTMEDFELHLGTVFTEVRFKQYLEIRSADCQRRHLIPAVAAFWKGILYDSEARCLASGLIRKWSEKDFSRLYAEVETKGLRARVRGTPVLDYAKQLVRMSETGLKNQKQFNEHEEDESVYLEPLRREVIESKETQAEQLVRLWKTSFRKRREALVKYLSVL